MRYTEPAIGEGIFDAGCGTGIFTAYFLDNGAEVTGLDISRQMLLDAGNSLYGAPFYPVQGDMTALPFKDNTFDKTVSVTAIEFIEDGQRAVDELFRVTKPGGSVILATLNSLSPWAERRDKEAKAGNHHVLENAYYRSPYDLLGMTEIPGEWETVVHFLKGDDPSDAAMTEKSGKADKLDSGAFVAVRWRKPL